MTAAHHNFAGADKTPVPTYLDRLNDLIKWALHERDQVKRYGDSMNRNGWVQLEMVKAGAAIADDWSEWASELDQSLNGDG